MHAVPLAKGAQQTRGDTVVLQSCRGFTTLAPVRPQMLHCQAPMLHCPAPNGLERHS